MEVDTKVIAVDTYWGSYIGIYRGNFKTHIGIFALIEIIENIKPPLQSSIFFSSNTFYREEYKKGEIHKFDFKNIKEI